MVLQVGQVYDAHGVDRSSGTYHTGQTAQAGDIHGADRVGGNSNAPWCRQVNQSMQSMTKQLS